MSTPTVEVPAPVAKPRPWFKKKRFVLPIAGVVLIIIASSGGGSSKGSAPLPQAPVAAAPAAPAVTEALVAEAPPVAEAPAPEPAASTCDKAREAILTGTTAGITKAMKALVADKTAPATAREYARYYTGRDKNDKQLREMDVSLIQMSCTV